VGSVAKDAGVGAPPGAVVGVRSLLDRARSVSRRSHRISWLSFGFLVALYGGIVVLSVLGAIYPVSTTTTLANGSTQTTTTWSTWGYLIAAPPALIVLGLLVRELVLGRAELRAGPGTAGPPPGDEEGSGWTQQAVEAQKLLADAKHETEISFAPLAFGLLGMGELVAVEGLEVLFPSTAALDFFVSLGLGFLALLALVPLYLLARGWILGNQALLDRQVREVSELEQAFLERFARTPA
jgi:hypothetical protein